MLDKDVVDTRNKAVDALNANIIKCPQGLCAVWSQPDQAYYLIYLPSNKALAQAAVGLSEIKQESRWDVVQSFEIARAGQEAELKKVQGLKIFDKDTIDSVSSAVDGLNRGLIQIPTDYCAVFSRSHGHWYIL